MAKEIMLEGNQERPAPSRLTFRVPGLDCPAEVALIESAWAPLEGVLEVRTNLLERTATAVIDPERTSSDILRAALLAAGLEALPGEDQRPPEVQYHLPQLEDTGAINDLEIALATVPGAGPLGVEFRQRTIAIPYDPARTSPSEIHQALLSTGLVVQAVEQGPSRPLRQIAEETAPIDSELPLPPSGPMPPPEPTGGTFIAPPAAPKPDLPHRFQLDDQVWLLIGGLGVWGIGALLYRYPVTHLAGSLMLIITTFVMGAKAFRRAAISLPKRRFDMHTLMSIAALGALLLGDLVEAAMLMWLFGVAMWVEHWNLDRARSAVQLLSARQPSRVRILVDGVWDLVPIERVHPGARALVRPGELVPLDGSVVAGQAAVDESAVTGESMPLHKEPGAPVFAGTLCTNGALEFMVTHGHQDSTVQRMRDLVLEAQSSRAPLQGVVDRFAARYTPLLLIFAAVLAIIPPLIFLLFNGTATPAVKSEVWGEWAYRALAVLVVACPCALVISTPVAFIAALGAAARQGILIKGGKVLEAASQLKVLAFDKTGTLTRGQPDLVQAIPIGVSQTDLLRLALTLEANATHPLAIAVARHAATLGLTSLEGLREFRQWGGKGLEARLGENAVALGSIDFLVGRHVRFDKPALDLLREAEGWGTTLVGVGYNGKLVGLLAFADDARPEAKETIAKLRTRGIERMELLTGDNHAVAGRLARDLGLDAVHANLLPEDKLQLLNELRAKYGHAGMVGDGLNDAPALAGASVGIAMGERGVAAAMETADVVLIGEDLGKVVRFLDLSRGTVQTIQQNIALALAIKGVFLITIALGYSGMWQAVVGDMGASLLVTANSLRLLRK